MTLNTVLSTTATHSPARPGGSSASSTHSTSAVSPPTTQPTPGKCAALARSMAGL